MNGNENAKTLWFLGVAALLVVVAWISRPATAVKNEASLVGKKLFTDFTDPKAVQSLQVLQFDQAKGNPTYLEVAKQPNGLWVIPSHAKYPADAKDHLAAAANSLIDVTIVGMAPGFDAGSPPMDPAALRKAHNRFGVADPDPEKVKTTDTGVGTRVTMKDAAGHQLASAIVGKAVADQPELYYVRIAKDGVLQDPVYVVKLDAAKLSVRFEDWIEPNLLNLNSMDLKKVEIKDYSVGPKLDPQDGQMYLARTAKGEFVLDAPAGDQPWKLIDAKAFDPAKREMVSRPLAADEEVNAANLDALKTALEDLKIVDVERKPAAVPADLHVRSIDDDAADTLAERGFFVVPNSDSRNGPLEVYSNAGDISLQLADGARYILRFGVTKGESSAAAAEKAKKKGAAKSDKEEKAKDESSPGMDRYLFVAADFNEDAIPKPVLEKFPEEKPAETTTKPADADKKGEAKKDEVKKDDVKKDEAKKDELKKDDAAKGDEAKKDEAKKDEPKKDDAAKGDEAKKDEAKKEEPKKDDAAKGDEVKKDEVKKDDAAKEAKSPEALAAERKRIETENKRRQDEYDGKVAAGKKHAKELSDRFAQWYYVIPSQTYAKIHLDRQAIVKKKEPPKDAAGHDHDHDDAGALPPSPAGTVEKLKQEGPDGGNK